MKNEKMQQVLWLIIQLVEEKENIDQSYDNGYCELNEVKNIRRLLTEATENFLIEFGGFTEEDFG